MASLCKLCCFIAAFSALPSHRLFHCCIYCPCISQEETLHWLLEFLRTMDRVLMKIEDVTPHTNNWSVKVRVHDKVEPRKAQNTPTKYQRLILVDEQGKKVSAVIFGDDIDEHKDHFKLNHTYIISNARVKPVDEKYRTEAVSHCYQWIISSRTAVVEETDKPLAIPNDDSIYTKFTNLEQLLGTRTLISIVAVLIDKLPQRTLVYQKRKNMLCEYVVIDQDMKPTVITLWNESAMTEAALALNSAQNRPVIAVTRLVLGTFYGISLSSTNLTSIHINPQHSKAKELHIWKDENEEVLDEIVASKEYFKRESVPLEIKEEYIVSLAHVLSSQNPNKYYARVRGRILDVTQSFYYIGCENCDVSIDAKYNWEFDCTRCQKRCIAKPKLKVHLNIYDEAQDVNVTLFATEAQAIIDLTADDCRKIADQGQALPFEDLNLNLRNKLLVVKLKKKIFEKYNKNEIQWSVSSMTVESEQEGLGSAVAFDNDSQVIPKDSVTEKTKTQKQAKRKLVYDNESSSKQPRD